ncbi:hypothetical protein [Shimia sp.]|uniref:phage tail tube protein n=1 Tax=Shimia sp. TaxID=1954381 RepID=UPI0032982B0A
MGNNTVLGRGKLFFDRFLDGTETNTGERYLGNTPSFGLSTETQELEHYSSEEGLRVKDLSVTLQIDYSASFVTDNIDLDNVAMFFFGTKEKVTQGAATGEEDVFSSVLQGMYYQIGTTATNPVGLRDLTINSVTGTSGSPTYVEGTDYEKDDALGRIKIIEGGSIADNSEIEVGYDIAAHTHDLVVSGSDLIYGALRFLSFNGVGEQKDFYMPKVALRPNGEYALKGEDWQQFGFNVEVLKKGTLENIYADGRPYTA